VAGLACLMPMMLTGCYTFSYLPSQPAPETRLALDLTDRGRAAEFEHLGPDVVRVEGYLVSLDDSAYTVRMERSVNIRGNSTPWNGEVVHIRTDYVATAREKRFSTAKSVLLAGVTAAGIVGFIATRGLIGSGSGGTTSNPPPPNGT
jgi:hypothetical protein